MNDELKQDTKDKNKIQSIIYDETLRAKKEIIKKYYKERVANKLKEESLIEIMCEVVEKFEIDEIDMANILKDDETMLNVIKVDCTNRNLLKEKDNHVDIGDIFN
jgi:hypothetical protein